MKTFQRSFTYLVLLFLYIPMLVLAVALVSLMGTAALVFKKKAA